MALYKRLDFPTDDQYWMVTWVSRVSLVENDFHFELQLASIDITKFTQSFYRSANYTRHYNTCIIGTSLFTEHAEVGSIWHKQQLIFSPSKHHAANPGLATYTVTLDHPAQAYNQSVHELDCRTENLAGFHPFPGLRYGSFSNSIREATCLVIDSPHFTIAGRRKTAFLVLPPSEVLRFYYCGSPYLFRQILGDGLARDQVYKRRATRYNVAKRELFVQLRKQVPDIDALIVGRLAGDSTSYWAARNVGRHIQQSLINSTTAQVAATFPFRGSTTLQVVGKLLKTNDKDNEWAFLIYSIISCSSTFPFLHLLFSRDNDNTIKSANSLHKPLTPAGIRVTTTPGASDAVSSTQPPSLNLASGLLRSEIEPARPKFTEAPPITRLPKEQRPMAVRGSIPRWYSRPDYYSTSPTPPSNSNESIGPVKPQAPELLEDAPGLLYNELPSVIDALQQLGVTCYCLDYWSQWAKSLPYKDFYIPAYRNLNTKDRKWLSIATGIVIDRHSPGKKRKITKRRKAVVIQLVYGRANFYLIECEASPTEHFSRMLLWPDHSTNLQHELNTLFGQLIKRKGIWRNFPFSPNLMTRTLHHATGETGVSLAQRIITYIKSMLTQHSKTPTLSRKMA